jgi:nucleoid-associated protein YgaU
MSDTSMGEALIINMDQSGGSAGIKCKFKPKEYAFTKQNTWTPSKAKGKNVPPFDFGGGQPAKLTMQLFFDTYGEAADGRPQDVRKAYTDAIWKLMMVDPSKQHPKNKKGRPPNVRFQWGKAWSFVAVITSINQKFTLFLADGTPVRATLDVTFQQIKDEALYPGTNPTSGGTGGERVWTIRAGDTLAWIAYQEYGDPTLWRRIADANHLLNVRRLTPGMHLEIPHA